tara:strand:- start:4218 stop:6035 length:1818 start_codon:yes stop_codon:yes gene_type:complete
MGFVFSKLNMISAALCLPFFLVGALLSLSNVQQSISSSSPSKSESELFYVEVESINNNSTKNWKKSVLTILSAHSKKESKNINERLLCYFDIEQNTVLEGDVLLVKSKPILIENKNNPGEFNSQKYWKTKHVSHMCFVSSDDFIWIKSQPQGIFKKATNIVRKKIIRVFESFLEKENLGLTIALVLGDKSLLDKDLKNTFSKAGAMHVLAVSGLHVGIVLYIIVNILKSASRIISRNKSIIISVFILWVYALITGMSPSVSRAVFMFSCLAFAQVSGRSFNRINILFFSAFVLLLTNPFLLYDLGFQLSYMAMLGIFLFYDKLSSLLSPSNKVLKWIWEGSCIGVSAQLTTIPIVLFNFHVFPNYFIITNIGMMFFAGAVLSTAISLVSLYWWGFLSKIIGVTLCFLLVSMLFFTRFIEGLPGASAVGFNLSFFLALALFFVVVFLLVRLNNKAQYCLLLLFYFFVVSLVVFNRNSQLNKNELCIFNHNQFLMTVKIRDKVFCFHESKEHELTKESFILDSYSKLNPGKVIYKNTRNTEINLSSKTCKIKLKNLKTKVLIFVNDKKYILYKKAVQDGDNAQKIYMPWIKKGMGHHLSDGAYVLPL